jgi:hypothetical protein
MKTLKSAVVAGMLLAATAAPSAALTSKEVLGAMDTRASEISVQINDLRNRLPTASRFEARVLSREIRSLNIRRSQLRSLARIVPRYNKAYLLRIATFFNLDVSLA